MSSGRVHVDDDGDGVGDRSVTIAMPDPASSRLVRIGKRLPGAARAGRSEATPSAVLPHDRATRFGCFCTHTTPWTRNADHDADFLIELRPGQTLMLPTIR